MGDDRESEQARESSMALIQSTSRYCGHCRAFAPALPSDWLLAINVCSQVKVLVHTKSGISTTKNIIILSL